MAQTQAQIRQQIVAAAKKAGIPWQVLMAIAENESGTPGTLTGPINPNAVGKGSFGAFQEQEGGQLVSVSEAENVAQAAGIAAAAVVAARRANPHATWGQIAMIAQKPEGYVPGQVPSPAETYAANVDAAISGTPQGSTGDIQLMAKTTPVKKNLGLGTPTTTTPPSGGGGGGGTLAPPVFGGTSTGPSTTEGSLGISSADQAQELVGDNSDWLGKDTNPGNAPRTIGQAVTGLYGLPKAQVSAIQSQLRAAGILTGKYSDGVMDDATKNAFVTAASEAVASKKSISQYVTSLQDATTVKTASTSTPAAPALTDPAENAVALQNAYTAQGLGSPTPAEYNAFQSKIEAQEEQRKATGVGTNPSSEATIAAEEKAAKTPGAATHVERSTDADIDKAAATYGVTLSPTERANIAAQVDANTKATGAPDVNLLNQLVAQQFKMPTDPSQLTGDAATLQNDLQKLAGQYLIPASATTISNFVTKGIRTQSYAGSLAGDTEAEFEQWLRQQASVQYPWLAKSTQNFQTVNPWDATSAYRTQISNVLGIGNPDSVDLTSQKYSPLLKSPDGVNPPSLQDIDTQILNDPKYGYDDSPNGISRGYSLGLNLAKSLGVNLAGV